MAHVSHHCHSMVVSCLLHLTDLLPGVVLVGVLQDVAQRIPAVVKVRSSWIYNGIKNTIRYNDIVFYCICYFSASFFQLLLYCLGKVSLKKKKIWNFPFLGFGPIKIRNFFFLFYWFSGCFSTFEEYLKKN